MERNRFIPMSSFKKELIQNNQSVKTKIKTDSGNNIKDIKLNMLNSSETLIIKQRLNKLFVDMRDVRHLDEERVGLHASAIIDSDANFCYRCQLLSLFYKQGQGRDLPIGLLRIFAEGNAIHEKWQNMFEKTGIAIKNEARSYSEKYDLYFTPDSLVKINGKIYVVEIKSMNTFAFKHAKSHPSGQKQCMLYMHLLGISNGFVLADDKNSQEFEIFPVVYDHEKVLPYIERLNEIQNMKRDFVENKVAPPRKCKDANVKRALECSMRDCCFNIGDGRKKLL